MINLSRLVTERILNGNEDDDQEGGSGGHGQFASGFISLPPEDFYAENTAGHSPQHAILAGERYFSGTFGRSRNGSSSSLSQDISRNEYALQNRLAHRMGNTNRLLNTMRPRPQ